MVGSLHATKTRNCTTTKKPATGRLPLPKKKKHASRGVENLTPTMVVARIYTYIYSGVCIYYCAAKSSRVPTTDQRQQAAANPPYSPNPLAFKISKQKKTTQICRISRARFRLPVSSNPSPPPRFPPPPSHPTDLL